MKTQCLFVTLYSSLLHAMCSAVSTVNAASLSEPIQECGVRFQDNGVCACSTYNSFASVKCRTDNHSVEVQPCYCTYYDQHLNMTIVGHCFFSCFRYSTTLIEITNSTEFNDICNTYDINGPLYRMGQFCGHCNNGYGLAVYSYKLLNCIPCQYYGYKNWLKYFAVALLPLTLFYIVAVLMSFNVTSSSLNGIVLVIQCISSPIQMTGIEGAYYTHTESILLKLAVSLFGMVNLDFFRYVYPSFCLHPKLNVFQVLSLDYIVALYPFFLIFITYVLVTAYDKQYRLLLWMWKPFKMCIHHYRKSRNIRTSLVELFSTFILLSSVKILGVSIQILSYTATYDVFGKRTGYYFSLYDGSTQYFGSQHLPFALLAIAISFIFVILPLLLLAVYPCGCFHRCLNCCGLNLQSLHVFMDAFQGSYRTQPRDMRYFSAFYLLLRVLMLTQIMTFPSALLLYISGILSLASAAILAIFQPYKVNAHNIVDSVLLLLMGVHFISYHEVFSLYSLKKNQWIIAQVLEEFAIFLLLLYLLVLIIWKLLHLKIRKMITKINSTVNNHDNGNKEMAESFDRNIYTRKTHNYVYPPLLGQAHKPTY